MAVSRPHIRQPMQPVPLLDPADREFVITQLLYSAQHASIHVRASKGARGQNKNSASYASSVFLLASVPATNRACDG